MSDAPQTFRDGRYAIVRVLGQGAQAETLEAVDKKGGQLVAVKRFRVRGAKSWKDVELAEREARVLTSIDHPLLPRYVEHFEEGGELFLVTRKIEGESLLELRKRGGAMAEREVVRLLRDASEALDYLHGRAPPLIHRDLKPSNVLRRPDGSFAFIDFGAVRDRMKPEGGSTVVGTFGYMAPEQFQGRAMPCSDVYAIGATALSMLTGTEPEDLPHRGLAIDVEAALRGRRTSRALVRALARMLEPDPDRRAARIAPLLGDLDDGGDDGPRRDRTSSPPSSRRGKKRERREDRERQRDAREQARERLREARDEVRDLHRRQREMAREISRKRRERRGPVMLPGFVLLFVAIGLTIAQIAVTLALRAAVPALLTLLSLFFGKGLRSAARNVSEAGKAATEAIGRARDVFRRSGEQEIAAAAPPESRGPRRVRIVPGDEKTRVRVEDEGAAEDELLAESEADDRKERRGR